MINDFIEIKKDEIINTICKLIEIPSISQEELAKESMPFGEECNNALEYFLQKASAMGFKTKNIDGYCGYAECGEGEELIGIIGHLDVVPAGDGWTKCDPFSPTIIDNKIYGRGAIDDKGPVVSSLYAMKYAMENFNLTKRIRLIVGLNEEVSWKCINYYKEHEEIPTIGFSPDADFPCIYAEKGFLNAYINSTYLENEKINIRNIKCDNAINIVPKLAEATLEINDLDINEVNTKITELNNKFGFHVDSSIINMNSIKITSTGVAAHSAYPDLGINALSRLVIILNNLLKNYSIQIPILEFIEEKINTEFNGNLLNLNFTDESGEFTLNLSNVSFKENELEFGINFRIPVTISSSIIKQKFNDEVLKYSRITLKYTDEKTALYVPKTDPLVITLCEVFNEETKMNEAPLTCPGATYARAFKNVVSFGATMPGKEDLCHQADEYIDIDDLMLATRIYIKALKKLTNN